MLWTLKKIYYRTYQKVLKFAMCFMDWKEPTLLEGENAVLKLPEFIKDKGVKKIYVVGNKCLKDKLAKHFALQDKYIKTLTKSVFSNNCCSVIQASYKRKRW